MTSCGVSTTTLVLPGEEGESRIVAVRSAGAARWELDTTFAGQAIFVALPEGPGELVVADYAVDLRASDACQRLHPTRVRRTDFGAGTARLLPADFLEVGLPETLAALLVPAPNSCAPACADLTATELMSGIEARTLTRVDELRSLISTRGGQLLEVDLGRTPAVLELCAEPMVGDYGALWLAPDGATLFAGDDAGRIARFDLATIRRDHRCAPNGSRAVLSSAIDAIDGGLGAGGAIELFVAGWSQEVAQMARLSDLVVTASAALPLPLPPTHRGSSLVRLGSDRALCTFDGQELLSWEAGALRKADIGQGFAQEIESLLRLPSGEVLAAVRGHGLYRRSLAGAWDPLGEEQGYEQVGAIVAEPERWFFSTAQGGIAQWIVGGGYCPVAQPFGDNRYRLAVPAGAGRFVVADAPRRGFRAGTMIARVDWSVR